MKNVIVPIRLIKVLFCPAGKEAECYAEIFITALNFVLRAYNRAELFALALDGALFTVRVKTPVLASFHPLPPDFATRETSPHAPHLGSCPHTYIVSLCPKLLPYDKMPNHRSRTQLLLD